MKVGAIVSLLICAFVTVGAASCRAYAPTDGPEARCVEHCEARVTNCDDHACVRGCRFILDRLVERECDTVLACVARATANDTKACAADRTWAQCSVFLGPYADGGPPAPQFKRWEDEEEN